MLNQQVANARQLPSSQAGTSIMKEYVTELGVKLLDVEIAYETYGNLSVDKNFINFNGDTELR